MASTSKARVVARRWVGCDQRTTWSRLGSRSIRSNQRPRGWRAWWCAVVGALWADEHLPLRKQARVLPPAIMQEEVAALVAFEPVLALIELSAELGYTTAPGPYAMSRHASTPMPSPAAVPPQVGLPRLGPTASARSSRFSVSTSSKRPLQCAIGRAKAYEESVYKASRFAPSLLHLRDGEQMRCPFQSAI